MKNVTLFCNGNRPRAALALAWSLAGIAGFAQVIRQLAVNPDQVAQLSQGALHRAAELNWDRKVERIVETYDRVMDFFSAACGLAIPRPSIHRWFRSPRPCTRGRGLG